MLKEAMSFSVAASLLFFISIFSVFHTPALAEDKDYIVLLRSFPYRPDNTAVDYDHAKNYHEELLGSCLGSIKKGKAALIYSYSRYINGFAATLSDEDRVKVKNHPNVISVFVSLARSIKTTNSWNFLGLEKDYDNIPLESAWKKARFGEDVIIGNIDSGITPESQSFSDEGMGPVPARWRGICQTNKKDGIKCNRKLIGVRYFNKCYLRYARRVARRFNTTFVVNPKVVTARDYHGHGTHTLSTAAGNMVANVSVFGHGKGTAKGGSPKARVAHYKVYWEEVDGHSCFDADILAAYEAAISDGVDVLSVSLSGSTSEFFADACQLGSFHAVRYGISVLASGGNGGPTASSVFNMPPWVFTVAASSTNREFANYVTLGNKKVLRGLSISEKGFAPGKFYPLIVGVVNDTLSSETAICSPDKPLDPKKVNESILVCVRSSMVSLQLSPSGFAGVISLSDKELGDALFSEHHVLPGSHLNYADGQSVFAYINSTETPVAHISNVQAELNKKPAPMMAYFSSRGPSMLDPDILKPDVTAPGVDLIAAFSLQNAPSLLSTDKRRVPYFAMSGTSASTPVVAGIVGLVKTYHPDWSPAAVKSAIMTTASTRDGSSKPILDYNYQEATPFAFGSGHVNPNSALDPGLVYDLNFENYLDYLCARGYNDTELRGFTVSDKPYSCPKVFNIGDFNYPSIAIPHLNASVKYTRYLKNVGSPGKYNVTVKPPAGVSISIEPSSLEFKKYGEEKKYEINFSPNKGNVTSKDYVFGELVWSDGYHNVSSPIAVKL